MIASLEVGLGAAVLFGVFAQRAGSPRFLSSQTVCFKDRLSGKLGQIGLAFAGLAAFLTILSGLGLMQEAAPAEHRLVVFLIGQLLIQSRVIFTLRYCPAVE